MGRPGRSWRLGRSLAWTIVGVLVIGCAPDPDTPALAIPPRPSDALEGPAFLEEIEWLELSLREQRIFEEAATGNVPGWMRALVPVQVEETLQGELRQLTFWVTPDYFAVGSDEEHVLLPVSPSTGQRIAAELGAVMPTPKMVDAIWASADVRILPQRIQPSDSIGSVRTVEFFERHHSVIQGQRILRGLSPDVFLAGHKKDVVISNALLTDPGKVAIYGWHQANGQPLQPLSTVPPEEWVYYSHGLRLVHRTVLLDGERMPIENILGDPVLAALLSDEGVIRGPFYPPSSGH